MVGADVGDAACPTASTTGTAAAFGVAHRTAYHVLRSVAAAAARRGARRARRRRRRRAGRGAARRARSARRSPRWRRRPRSSTPPRRTGATHLDRPPRRRPAGGAARGAARRRRRGRRPGRRRRSPSRRCASLRYGGRFVTVGYASGEIPRIPLNLVLLKGVQILGFQFRRLRDPRARRDGRNEAELLDAARRRPRPCPHIGATFPLDERRGRAALRGRRQGDRQGRPRRPVTQTVRSSVKVSVSWPKSSRCWSRRV